MKFEDQHPQYKTYSHEDYYMNKIPFGFLSDLKGFIHSQLTNEDPEDMNRSALALQYKLSAIASSDPAYIGSYEDIFGEITSTLRKLENKGFANFMDGLASILSQFECEEEFNHFLEEMDIGYVAVLWNGEVSWELREDVEIPVKKIEDVLTLIPNVYKDTIARLEQVIKLFNDAENEKARKSALAECISAVEGFMKSVTGTTNIKAADTQIRNKNYSHPIITSDAIKVWRHINDNLLDVRHGNNEFISKLGIEEVTYYIERLVAYIKYLNSKTK